MKQNKKTWKNATSQINTQQKQEFFFMRTSIPAIDYIQLAGYKGQILNKVVAIKPDHVKRLEEVWGTVLFGNPDIPLVNPSKYSNTGKDYIVCGHHRQAMVKNLINNGLLDKETLIPINYINKQLTLKEIDELAFANNFGHASNNAKEQQVLGNSEAAKKLYQPILSVFKSLNLTKITRSRQIQNTLYLASLLNDTPSFLKQPKGIRAHKLYKQRHTAIGSAKHGDHLRAEVKIDLRNRTDEIAKIITTGMTFLDALKKDNQIAEVIGNNKHIEYLFTALGCRGLFANNTSVKKKYGKITLNDLKTFFTDKKYKYTISEWLVNCNNEPEKMESEFMKMLYKGKRGLSFETT